MTRSGKYIVCGLVLLVSACGSDEPPAPDSDSTRIRSIEVSVTVSPAPSQPSSNRAPVKFDPCFEISDQAISQAGYNPETRERIDQVHEGWAFIGCTFERIESVRGQRLNVGGLTITSTNTSVDEIRKKNEGEQRTVQDTEVDGRRGITYRVGGETCVTALPGPDAALSIMVDSTAALTEWSACEHMQQTAEIIEAALPK
ncbi:DUF3558 domain-containing protein [Nocardia sp. NPDC058519]|uniref:DUF3558 domain-containing protein n=1 Tax=Nocardia sp. NPDC058519 TaxID=3346535 RepID=UPI0036699C9D